jgi:hypothetical protein
MEVYLLRNIRTFLSTNESKNEAEIEVKVRPSLYSFVCINSLLYMERLMQINASI